jgi:hypothetical protein
LKRSYLILSIFFLAICPLEAQWYSKTYSLAAGWSGIWLQGDASYTTVADLFASNSNITEVWRWNPNPVQVQFSDTPSTPTTNSEEWTVWKRNDPTEQVLQRMVANSAYLINNSGASATSVTIKQQARSPVNTWLISGSNFMGFPSAGTSSSWPILSNYFASFINGSNTGLPSGTKIYKYVGGPLSSSNPLQVINTTERLDPDKAYWINLATVSNFTGAVEYEVPGSSGLIFGRTASALTVGVTNRSTTSLTLTISLDGSEAAPTGQAAIRGAVPLTKRVFNSSTNSYDETSVPTTGSSPTYTVTVAAGGRTNLDFGVNRSSLSTTSSDFYASVLRIKDSAGLTDVRLPVSVQPATAAGLWIAKVDVSRVASTQPTSGTTTTRPFTLPVLMHLDSNGNARLLRQAFSGRLVASGNPLGLAISESRVLGLSASDVKPMRFYMPMMPAGSPTITAAASSATFAAGSSVLWNITHSYNDPLNPFVHTYHPDHDNLDARFSATPLSAGKESYTVVRACTFSFTSSPPNGATVTGWGTTVLGGNYTETLTGLNKATLTVSGTFAMRRLSEIADIDLSNP